MTGPHDPADVRKQATDLLEQLLADHRVRFHEPLLRVGEPTGLADDLVWDPDLPDVVQQRGELRPPPFPWIQVELVGGREHEIDDVPAVTARIGVICLDDVTHGTGGSLTAPLRIDAIATDPVLGLIKTVPLVHPLLPFWLPSLPLPVLVNLGGALDLDADRSLTTQLSFRGSFARAARAKAGPFAPLDCVDGDEAHLGDDA